MLRFLSFPFLFCICSFINLEGFEGNDTRPWTAQNFVKWYSNYEQPESMSVYSRNFIKGLKILTFQELWALFNYISDGEIFGDLRNFVVEYENPILCV